MKDKDVHLDDEYGGEDNKMGLSEDDRTCSVLNREKKIEEALKKVEKEESECEDEESVEWDGSEAERVADTDVEEYEENATGIKFTYRLEKEEIYKGLKHSKAYRKNASLQAKHTIIQAILVLVLIVSILMHNLTFIYVALIPVLSVIGIWVLPEVSLKRLSKDMSSKKSISVEIFPDVIDVNINGVKREILLDGKCEYEEFDGLIILSPPRGTNLIIPVRSIEPEFLPDVQAMIVSGTLPGNQG